MNASNNRLAVLKRYLLFVFLLPVFFVLHGFTENYGFVPAADALLLTGIYVLSSLVLFWAGFRFYKSRIKAALLTFLLMAIYFFFGSIQDGLRDLFPGSFLSKWIFLAPALFVIIVSAILFLKRSKQSFYRLSLYLNVLLLVVIAIDVVQLIRKSSVATGDVSLPDGFVACPTCTKPDIYLVIADEYPGNTELRELLGFDNSAFEQQLVQRDFHVVPHSSSNYNYTPYSIASTLNMDYLQAKTPGQPLLVNAYETTGQNKFLKFLEQHSYKFYNYSLSDFKGHPTYAQASFLPVKTKLITGQTLLSRLEKELGFHWIMRSKKAIRRHVYINKENNEMLSRMLIQSSGERSDQPRFFLAHLMMPHYPYYFDRNGNEFPLDSIVEGNQHNQRYFTEYLQYTNKKLLELVDHIQKNSVNPPIIILLGDHGFRHFTKPVNEKYYFMNLMSIYLPGKNYSTFKDSLTNVNLLRVVLNTAFNQRLPYLQDTTYIMENP